jgi:hypothetical protein
MRLPSARSLTGLVSTPLARHEAALLSLLTQHEAVQEIRSQGGTVKHGLSHRRTPLRGNTIGVLRALLGTSSPPITLACARLGLARGMRDLFQLITACWPDTDRVAAGLGGKVTNRIVMRIFIGLSESRARQELLAMGFTAGFA